MNANKTTGWLEGMFIKNWEMGINGNEFSPQEIQNEIRIFSILNSNDSIFGKKRNN